MKVIVEVYKDVTNTKFETTIIDKVTAIDFDINYTNFFVQTKNAKYYYSTTFLKRLELTED